MIPTRAAVAAVAAGLALALTGCGADDDPAAAATPSTTSAPAVEGSTALVPEGPFGPGCAAVPTAGEGSFAGMADDPVMTAAASVPALSGFVTAVRSANLVDSFNGQSEVTVLAPANAAFRAIPPASTESLLADTPRITALLTHHVIQGRVTPDRLAGTHITLNNDEITLEGSGDAYTVPGEQTAVGTPAAVVCGNVQTANATVYIIDQVLTPPAA